MKKLFITIFIIAFILSALSIWSMTQGTSSEELAKKDKSTLTCSAQGDVRPPAWEEEDDKTTSGS